MAQVFAEHLLQFPSAGERRAELGEVAVLLAWDNNAVPAAAVFHLPLFHLLRRRRTRTILDEDEEDDN